MPSQASLPNRHTDRRIPQTAKVVLDSSTKSYPCLQNPIPSMPAGRRLRRKQHWGCRRNSDSNTCTSISQSTDRFGIFASTPDPCPSSGPRGEISSHLCIFCLLPARPGTSTTKLGPFSCWRAGEAQASNGRCRGKLRIPWNSLKLPHARRDFSPSWQGLLPGCRCSTQLAALDWLGARIITRKKGLRPANCEQK